MVQVNKGQWNGYETVILENDTLAATLLPELGCNVIRLWDKKAQRDILRTPAESDLDYYMTKPYHFGIPMLMPPGRIRRGSFTYEGVSYQFDQNTANDNHIHGLHRLQSWTVTRAVAAGDAAEVTAQLRTADDDNWMRQYPAPLELEVAFRLQGGTLTQQLTVINQGEQSAPFGFGTHTWFLIDGEPNRWTMQVPVAGIYELDEELITTGKTLPLGDNRALLEGMNLEGADFDTVFSAGEGKPEAWLTREDGYRIRYAGSQPHFKHWVLYTRGTADEIICVEPYTWLTDAPNLPFDSETTGLIDLKPQAPVTLTLNLEIIHP
ncbi:aldose 1-epimerase [Paenibacillus dendritiformis]|uniref:Aldose 1-epimerase n=1 Tax=Paenibacillus dendritiformis C454 TaxID=1131935 RepID=H3SCG6_9BACL|nr:aldose 1-epimerase [Paenibacillus dendritiformis]EHQ63240.1 aldose 1-epimerase [Paenibacillus dendritiformis C454]CAH8769116.1 aldose 1-epimerase [Paenibacillus dendritiformis]